MAASPRDADTVMLDRLRRWASRNAPEARLVLRITIAGVAAFLLARAFDLAQPYWAVITAVIIMQASVGGSLKAVIDRFIGTLAGAGFRSRGGRIHPPCL